MSHSKMSKRGRSLFVEKWNPKAKKFIVTCGYCGHVGYTPNILKDDFADTGEKRAIQEELTKILKPLQLDDQGLCKSCRQLHD